MLCTFNSLQPMKEFIFSIASRATGQLQIKPSGSWDENAMCTAAVHLGLQFYNWRIDYPHNELLVTFLVRNRTYGHDFLRVQFFSTKFLHTRLSVGGASLLENWILKGDEQGNFPVNAFVFLSIVFGFFFLEQSYEWMIELTCY